MSILVKLFDGLRHYLEGGRLQDLELKKKKEKISNRKEEGTMQNSNINHACLFVFWKLLVPDKILMRQTCTQNNILSKGKFLIKKIKF